MTEQAPCSSQYTRPGGREPGDRIVRCHLPAGHPGDHEEAVTEVTWSRRAETETAAPTLRAGDVVRYTPHTTWCRDGYAIAEQQTDRVVLVDTYWSGYEGVVAPDTYEVLFNLGDYDEKPHGEYETFAPADRQFIPRHHHHRPLYLVRKGAEPDLATQIANAELSLAAAEDELRSAQWRVERRREDLAALRDRKAAVTQ